MPVAQAGHFQPHTQMMPTASGDHPFIDPFDRHDLEAFPGLRGLLAEPGWTSKIYHAIDMVDKTGTRLLCSLRDGTLNARRYLAIIEHIRRRRCGRVLEVGVWRGDTSELLVTNSLNESIEYHGVDVFDDTSEELIAREVSLPADSEAMVRNRLARLSSRVHLHRGFSRDVLPRLRQSGIRFDVIWLDGGHSYETVAEDFVHCLALLDDGGTLFFDDYTTDPYLPDVKRFIDDELLNDPALVVTIHDDYADHYRGYDYRVVSVGRRSAASRSTEAVGGQLPAGFYYHLLHGVAADDLPWEAPYLLSQARFCLEHHLCVGYACSLLDQARPFLSSGQLVEAARLIERGGRASADAARFLLDAVCGEAAATEAVVDADALLSREGLQPALEGPLAPLSDALEEILDSPDRFVRQGPDEIGRRIELGLILRGRLRLHDSEEQLAKAVASAPGDERAVREHRETVKALIRRAHRSGDWREARRLHGLAAVSGTPDVEWQQLLAVTESQSPVVRGLDTCDPGERPSSPTVENRKPQPKFCSSFWTEGVLLMTGDLQFCCRNPTVIGNYERDGLEACWHSDVAREMRRKVVAGEYPDAHCEACHRIGATYPLGRPLGGPLGRLGGALERAAGTSLLAIRALASLFGRRDLDAESDRVLAAFDASLAEVGQRPDLLERADVQRVTRRLTLLAEVVRSYLAGDEAPSVVAPAREVNLIAVCNARCVHCIGLHYDQLGKGLTGPDGRFLKTIGPDTHRAALEHPDHIFEFWCNGTEFLIYPRWKEIYRSLAERQIVLSLSTNGIALTEDAVRTLIDGGAATGLNVSVDGATRETVEAIRVNVRYDDLVKNLRFLIRYSNERRAKYNLNFTFTIMRRNHREIPQFVEFVHALFEGEARIPGTILFTFLQPEGNASYYDFVGREHHSLVDQQELECLLTEARGLAERYGFKANVTYNHSIQDFIAMGFPFPPLPAEARLAMVEHAMLAAHPPQQYGREIPWEMPTQLCLSDFLVPGDCALDVGANVGGLSVALARMVGPGGQVHSFEANPRLLPVLKRDLALNVPAGNVTTVGLAAWSTSGEHLRLHCDERQWAQGSSLVYNVSDAEESVETIRLDDYVGQHGLSPAAIKLDVEGAEWEALAGAEATLRDHAPVVALEYWPRGRQDPLDLLEAHGYTCFDTNRYTRVDRAYYRRHPLRNIVANVIALPSRVGLVYAAVALREVADVPIAGGGLRSADLDLPSPGRYRARVDLEGPDGEGITLVITGGEGHLVVIGGSVAEVAEWGQAGLIFQTDAPIRVHAVIFLSGETPSPVRLRRVVLSEIEGVRAWPSPGLGSETTMTASPSAAVGS
jgi:FkbM family methyltransferase